jgi:hypothetical protein
VADNPEQHRRVQAIARAYTSYIRDYSDPLIATARQDPVAARTGDATDEGKQRMDAIRADFDRLMASETQLSVDLQRRSDTAAGRAIAAAAGGLAGSFVLIAVFAGYLTRAIVRPVRKVVAMTERLAPGEPCGAHRLAGPDRDRRRPGEKDLRRQPDRARHRATGRSSPGRSVAGRPRFRAAGTETGRWP